MDWTELANKHRRGDGLPKMIREPSPSDEDVLAVYTSEHNVIDSRTAKLFCLSWHFASFSC